MCIKAHSFWEKYVFLLPIRMLMISIFLPYEASMEITCIIKGHFRTHREYGIKTNMVRTGWQIKATRWLDTHPQKWHHHKTPWMSRLLKAEEEGGLWCFVMENDSYLKRKIWGQPCGPLLRMAGSIAVTAGKSEWRKKHDTRIVCLLYNIPHQRHKNK